GAKVVGVVKDHPHRLVDALKFEKISTHSVRDDRSQFIALEYFPAARRRDAYPGSPVLHPRYSVVQAAGLGAFLLQENQAARAAASDHDTRSSLQLSLNLHAAGASELFRRMFRPPWTRSTPSPSSVAS